MGSSIRSPQLSPRPLQRQATFAVNKGVRLRPLPKQFAPHTKRRSRRALCTTPNLIVQEPFQTDVLEVISAQSLMDNNAIAIFSFYIYIEAALFRDQLAECSIERGQYLKPPLRGRPQRDDFTFYRPRSSSENCGVLTPYHPLTSILPCRASAGQLGAADVCFRSAVSTGQRIQLKRPPTEAT